MYYWESITENDIGYFLDSSARLKITETLQREIGVNSEIDTIQKLYEFINKKMQIKNITEEEKILIGADVIIEDYNLSDKEKVNIIQRKNIIEYFDHIDNDKRELQSMDILISSYLRKYTKYYPNLDVNPFTSKIINENKELTYDDIKKELIFHLK